MRYLKGMSVPKPGRGFRTEIFSYVFKRDGMFLIFYRNLVLIKLFLFFLKHVIYETPERNVGAKTWARLPKSVFLYLKIFSYLIKRDLGCS